MPFITPRKNKKKTTKLRILNFSFTIDDCSPRQDILRFYRDRRSIPVTMDISPLGHIQFQLNPIHSPLLSVCLKIILPNIATSFKCYFLEVFQSTFYLFDLPNARDAYSVLHLPRFTHQNNRDVFRNQKFTVMCLRFDLTV